MMSFDHWLFGQGLSQKIARHYVGVIKHEALSNIIRIITQPHFGHNQLNGVPFHLTSADNSIR